MVDFYTLLFFPVICIQIKLSKYPPLREFTPKKTPIEMSFDCLVLRRRAAINRITDLSRRKDERRRHPRNPAILQCYLFFLPAAKPTGLVEAMSVCLCVCVILLHEAFGSQLMLLVPSL